MSDDVAIRMKSVGKMYKLFPSRLDNFLDAINWQRFIPLRAPKYKKFWALRGIDLELKKGYRIGILGRNGAGKSTLLKLITGNLAPTEGEIHVNGQIQALMDTGAGFHPEFTGYENVRASLTYLGMSPAQMDEALEDIIEFTELDEFMGQPFKTYSSGMQARLSFATATSIKPDILIIDEVLGAGDGYFISKSTERMKSLIDNGASVLLVSHALDTITKICDQAIWIDRGRIVMQGQSLDVVKSYERFLRELDDKRLKARNFKKFSGKYSSHQFDGTADCVMITLSLESDSDCECDVREIRLLRGGEVLERIDVGAPQDASVAEPGFVMLESGTWSEPIQDGDAYHRKLVCESDSGKATGSLAFNLLAMDESEEYRVELEYRCHGQGELSVAIHKNSDLRQTQTIPTSTPEWRKEQVMMSRGERETAPSGEESNQKVELLNGSSGKKPPQERFRWPSEGTIKIMGLMITDGLEEQTVFEAGATLELRIRFQAVKDGRYPLLPVAVIFRMDGINVSTHLGEWEDYDLKAGDELEAVLSIDNLNLGNGFYTFSAALYKSFDLKLQSDPVAYDLIDRSVDFKVTGAPPALNSIFMHPSIWTVR